MQLTGIMLLPLVILGTLSMQLVRLVTCMPTTCGKSYEDVFSGVNGSVPVTKLPERTPETRTTNGTSQDASPFKSKIAYYKVSQRYAENREARPVKYMVVVDAGSTGSRAFVYSWLVDETSALLPDFQLLTSIKVWPGLSAFAEPTADSMTRLDAYMSLILDHCGRVITGLGAAGNATVNVKTGARAGVGARTEPGRGPSRTHGTPVYVFATAGMRMLKASQTDAVMTAVGRLIRASPHGFYADSRSVAIIDGALEGTFGWMATNYFTGALPQAPNYDPKHLMTHGMLDIGGASLQIAYEVAPEDDNGRQGEGEGEGKDEGGLSRRLTEIPVRGQNGCRYVYRIFVHSFLGFGTNEARRTFHGRQKTPGCCYPTGLVDSAEDVKAVAFEGNGDFERCYGQVQGTLSELLKDAGVLRPQYKKKDECPSQESSPIGHWLWRILTGRQPQTPLPPCKSRDHGLPRPRPGMTVIGGSEVWNILDDVFHGSGGRSEPMAFDAAVLFKQSVDYCATSWAALQQQVQHGLLHVTEEPYLGIHEKLKRQCFRSAWLLAVMQEFFGLSWLGEKSNCTDNDNDKGNSSHSKSKLPFEEPIKVFAYDVFPGDIPMSWTVAVPMLFHHESLS